MISLIQQVVYFSQMYYPSSEKRKKPRIMGPGPILVYPCGFFYGASAKSGGIGFSLHLNETHSFEFVVGVGQCTNTKAELVGLWALLLTTHMMGIPSLQVFGDSLVIINWAKGKSSLSPPELHYWFRVTRKIFSHFLALSFDHIYREHNQLANRLSKVTPTLAPGSSTYSEFLDGHSTSHGNIKLFGVGVGIYIPFILAPLYGAGSFSLLIICLSCTRQIWDGMTELTDGYIFVILDLHQALPDSTC